MKTFLMWCFVAVIFCSCGLTRQTTLSDYSCKGRFREYQTFDIVRNANLPSEDVDIIEAAIDRRLQSMGYRYETKSPSLLISYQLFTDDIKVITYEQPSIYSWMHDSQFVPEDAVYNIGRAKIKGGSMVIHLFDYSQQRVVWSGYRMMEEPHESYRELVYTINRILDEYILAPSISSELAFRY